jgi:acetyltransferase-like isoleucine patch superfamily enzyme
MESPYKSPDFMQQFARVGANVKVFQWALVLKPEVIEIGDGTRIDDYTRLEGGIGLRIGRFVHIASFASILGGGRAEMGDCSGLAQGARVITGAGHPCEEWFPMRMVEGDPYFRARGRCVLGAYSFVAANGVVLPNVNLGEGAVVAAGAVATRDVPPWTIVAGVPAKVVGKRKRPGGPAAQ